jgi:hypothetical protein
VSNRMQNEPRQRCAVLTTTAELSIRWGLAHPFQSSSPGMPHPCRGFYATGWVVNRAGGRFKSSFGLSGTVPKRLRSLHYPTSSQKVLKIAC